MGDVVIVGGKRVHPDPPAVAVFGQTSSHEGCGTQALYNLHHSCTVFICPAFNFHCSHPVGTVQTGVEVMQSTQVENLSRRCRIYTACRATYSFNVMHCRHAFADCSLDTVIETL